jgi:hypothetical protein
MKIVHFLNKVKGLEELKDKEKKNIEQLLNDMIACIDTDNMNSVYQDIEEWASSTKLKKQTLLTGIAHLKKAFDIMKITDLSDDDFEKVRAIINDRDVLEKETQLEEIHDTHSHDGEQRELMTSDYIGFKDEMYERIATLEKKVYWLSKTLVDVLHTMNPACKSIIDISIFDKEMCKNQK